MVAEVVVRVFSGAGGCGGCWCGYFLGLVVVEVLGAGVFWGWWYGGGGCGCFVGLVVVEVVGVGVL